MRTPSARAVDCDVAVVGAGVVGAAAALALHRAGLRVRLLERTTVPASADEYDLRVYALSLASIALLERLGVWPAVAGERSAPYTHMQVWETAPAAAMHFDAADAGAPVLGHIVEHRVLLRRLCAALPAGVLREGVGVEALAADADAAVLQLSGGGTLRSSLVIAADGAESPLRTAQDIAVVRELYAQRAVVCHVRTQLPHRDTAFQRFLPDGPLALLPLADGRSSLVWSSESADALMAQDDAAFCATLSKASQHALGEIQAVSRRVCVPLMRQHAERYVATRLLLAGDAAHVVHPLAGQGLNLGLGDVAALVETIGGAHAARRDVGGPRILARYQRTRLGEVREMLALTEGLYQAYRLRLPGWPQLRARAIGWVEAATPLKRQLVRRACGL